MLRRQSERLQDQRVEFGLEVVAAIVSALFTQASRTLHHHWKAEGDRRSLLRHELAMHSAAMGFGRRTLRTKI